MNDKPTSRICSYDADHIHLRGKDLVDEVIGHYDFGAAFLLQALGKDPSPKQRRALDIALVTIMEHGLVPSAVTARLTLHGAPESLQGAVAAGLLGVGDRYAGTASLCAADLAIIVAAEDMTTAADNLVANRRDNRAPIPGFGHPIHTGKDPRVEKLLSFVPETSPVLTAAKVLESSLSQSLNKSLVMNVSTALAVLLVDAEIPASMIRGVILIARCAGLVGHLLEEHESPIGDALWNGATNKVEQIASSK
jgi:citrate synthase